MWNFRKYYSECVKKEDVQVLKELENSDFKIGEIVTFTHKFRVSFEAIEILGFSNNTDFLPKD